MEKILRFSSVGALTILFLGLAFWSIRGSFETGEKNIEYREVKGFSMEPLVLNGSIAKLMLRSAPNFSIQRGDAISFDHPSSLDPLFKRVYGVPGDKLSFQEVAPATYYILVNGGIVQNSLGQPFVMGEKSKKMLEFASGTDGVIPQGAYLVLGDKADGTRDSRVFGLVKSEIVRSKLLALLPSAFRVNIAGFVDASGAASWSCTVRSAYGSGGTFTATCSGSEKAISGGCSDMSSGGLNGGQNWSCTFNSAGYTYVNCCL